MATYKARIKAGKDRDSVEDAIGASFGTVLSISAEDVTLVSFGPVGLLAAMAVLGAPVASLAIAGVGPACR